MSINTNQLNQGLITAIAVPQSCIPAQVHGFDDLVEP